MKWKIRSYFGYDLFKNITLSSEEAKYSKFQHCRIFSTLASLDDAAAEPAF